MQILHPVVLASPISFAGDRSASRTALTRSISGESSSNKETSDVFQKCKPQSSNNRQVAQALQAAGEKALLDYQARKNFYTDVLVNKIPEFWQHCENNELDVRQEAVKIAEERAMRETKWPTFPGWEYSSEE
jgi:hypothetical protein